MKAITLFFVFVTWNVTAQTHFSEVRHELTVAPFSTTFHRRFFIGHALNYRFNFSKNYSIEASTDGTLFTSFDGMKRTWRNENSVPNFNQSQLVLGKNFVLGNGLKPKTYSIGAFFGAHYFQRANEQEEYWILDKNPSASIEYLSGFRTYSFMAGLQFQRTKTKQIDNKTVFKNRHGFNIAYLYGFRNISLGLIDDKTSVEQVPVTAMFPFNPNGFKLSYLYDRKISNQLNFNFGAEFLWAPFVDYTYNKNIHVPRGGKMHIPYFVNVKVGLTFRSRSLK